MLDYERFYDIAKEDAAKEVDSMYSKQLQRR